MGSSISTILLPGSRDFAGCLKRTAYVLERGLVGGGEFPATRFCMNYQLSRYLPFLRIFPARNNSPKPETPILKHRDFRIPAEPIHILKLAMNSSSYTISNLRRMTNSELSQHILNAPITPNGTLAIVDVRDSDYIGGHIRGCINVPSPSLDWKIPELVRQLKDKEIVVFHCALSQQRGPNAALSYLREKERIFPANNEKGGEEEEQKQHVYVLEGGFVKWQEKYGEDERLTEGYEKDIWEFGY